MMHEAQLHKDNWFVTLTYNDEHNPHTLVPEHLTKFIKRLRHHKGTWDEHTRQNLPRYFACGEYGERTNRPHYHVCLFGMGLEDAKHYSGKGELALYSSSTLESIWGYGNVLFGRVTHESAQYTAGYCTKKITGKKAKEHYEYMIPDTGEIIQREPEFARMSLKPAIGRRWIEKYTQDVYNYDHVVVNGREQKAPRYYDKYLAAHEPARLEQWKKQRKEKAKENEQDNTTARLKVKAQITKARMKLKQRTL